MSTASVILIILLGILALAAWVRAARASAELRVQRAHFPYGEDDLVDARRDALARSHTVVRGRVKEHLAPLLPEFAATFDARDARFLGSPVDFVVFDGLDEGEVRRVVFVEVKTGGSQLSTRERRVRDAVEAGRVEWQVLRLPGVEADATLAGTSAVAPDPLGGLHDP